MAAPTRSDPTLTWQHFPTDENGFLRAPVLVSGPTEALLIDGGFNFSDGRALAESIRATGKRLTTIYISQSDPDYYFSLKPIRAAFPDARVLAAPETLAAIKGNIAAKLQVWGPQLGANGPQTLDDIVLPEAYGAGTLGVDGETVEIVPAEGMANRRHLRVPSLDAIFGGVLIFGDIHVWVADTPDAKERAAWVANLDRIIAAAPKVVVPGHLRPGSATDLSGVEQTRRYLLAFEEELARAADAAALTAAMDARFPGLANRSSLELGAKVVTGEMAWG